MAGRGLGQGRERRDGMYSWLPDRREMGIGKAASEGDEQLSLLSSCVT